MGQMFCQLCAAKKDIDCSGGGDTQQNGMAGDAAEEKNKENGEKEEEREKNQKKNEERNVS